MSEFERGVAATKQAIAAKVKDMACYFDRFETYSGKYSAMCGTESLNPEQIAELLTDVEVQS